MALFENGGPKNWWLIIIFQPMEVQFWGCFNFIKTQIYLNIRLLLNVADISHYVPSYLPWLLVIPPSLLVKAITQPLAWLKTRPPVEWPPLGQWGLAPRELLQNDRTWYSKWGAYPAKNSDFCNVDLPIGNTTWQWKIQHLQMILLIFSEQNGTFIDFEWLLFRRPSPSSIWAW